MPDLPEHPNLDQLRHQARDLLDDAKAGKPEALRRLRAVSRVDDSGDRTAPTAMNDLEVFQGDDAVRVRLPLPEDPLTPNLQHWMGEYRQLARQRGVDAFVEEVPGKVVLEVKLGAELSADETLAKHQRCTCSRRRGEARRRPGLEGGGEGRAHPCLVE